MSAFGIAVILSAVFVFIVVPLFKKKDPPSH